MGVSSDGWHRAADRSTLPAGGALRVEIGRLAIALYDADGTVYATADTCTHAQASLSEGYLDGESIECPLHQACFHVPTGRVLAPPATEPLAVYPVRVAEGAIWVQIRASDPGRGGTR
ncbi:MAG TPA: non-heme iron oxygenase ferredoxin subunit [Candidatus Binatia bacterium]|nr:non-heme iron oxygenase ferredoxin subunit [Candidatus Binatia bacterium]